MKRINLLPKPKQKELGYERLFYSFTVVAVVASCILLLGIVAQLGVWAYFDHSQKAMAKEIAELKQATDKTENAQLKQEIKSINNTMADFETLSKKVPQWSKVISAFGVQVPNGVEIMQFNADGKTGKVDITGHSPTRDLVIELYNNINADKEHFRDIDYPLENVSQPADVQFHFTFFIIDGVLVPTDKK